MVKLLAVSDLHVEFVPFKPDGEGSAAADVVVLAGVTTGCLGNRLGPFVPGLIFEV